MYKQFLDFEELNNLYDTIPDWELYRKSIYYFYSNNNSNTNIKNRISFSLFFDLLSSLLWLIPFPIFSKVVYIGHPRYIQNHWYDENLENLKNTNNSFIYINQSKQLNLKNVFHRRVPFLLFKLLSIIISRIKRPPVYFKTLNQIVSNETGKQINILDLESIRLYNNFVFLYFDLLFSISSLSKVFFVRSDNYTSLLKAAKKNNIQSFEFQHGDIVKEELSINHPKIKKSKVSYADKLLVYSNIWTKDLSVFSDVIEIGKKRPKQFNSHSSNIILVLEIFNPDEQIKFCNQLAKLLYITFSFDKNFIIKVHPSTSQVDFYKQLKGLFINYPLITVVYTQQLFENLLNKNSLVIGKYSTALFYSSDLGVNTFVVKSKIREFPLELNTVKVFNSYKDLFTYLKDNFHNILNFNQNLDFKPTYFKNFNIKLLSRIILN